MYRFDYPDPSANSGLGACHAVELPFVFDNLHCSSVRARVGDNPSQAVADRTHAIWVGFARGEEPGWPAYRSPERTVGLLGEKVEVAQDPLATERQAWAVDA